MQDTITLKANTNQVVRVAGKFLSIVSCTAALLVEMDQGGKSLAVAGSQLSSADGFSKLTFFETSGADNVVTYDASDTPSPGRSTVVSAAASTFPGANSGQYDLGSSANPAFVTFKGTDSQGRARKLIYITNSGRSTIGGAASTALAIVTINGAWVAAVFPGTTLSLETNGDVTVAAGLADLSGFATHLNVFVFEVFYSKPLQTDQ